MMIDRFRSAACVVAAILALEAGSLASQVGQTPAEAVAPPPAAAKASLAGVWKLNTQQSDPPRGPRGGGRDGGDGGGRVTGGQPPGGGGGGGGFGRGGGMGGGMGRGGGMGGRPGMGGREAMDPEKMAQMRALIEEVLETPATLTISEGDGAVSFTEADGRTRTYKTDGRKEKHQATNGTVETRSRWEDSGSLVIETDLGQNGVKAMQTFTASGDPRQLVVLVKVEGGRMPQGRQPMRRVYDDSTPGAQ